MYNKEVRLNDIIMTAVYDRKSVSNWKFAFPQDIERVVVTTRVSRFPEALRAVTER